MFLYLLIGLLVGASVHVAVLRDRSTPRIGEIVLLWLLVGYCGVPMVVVSLLAIVHPHEVAHDLGFEPENPFQLFLNSAYLGMSLIAVLALRYRGTYLVAPAIVWAVFFIGATFIHWGEPSHGAALFIFATHGLISVLLLVALGMSGVWRRPRGV